MKGTYLGEFEEIVLLTVAMLEDQAYGISVKLEVEKRPKIDKILVRRPTKGRFLTCKQSN